MVLSRWPIATVADAELPRSPDDERRAVTCAVLDAPSGPITVFNTQLTSAPSASARRVEQVRRIATFVAEHRVESFPPIVTGDFNAMPESDEIRLFEGHLTDPVVPDTVLVDAWRYDANPASPGWTRHCANPYVEATFEPSAVSTTCSSGRRACRPWPRRLRRPHR